MSIAIHKNTLRGKLRAAAFAAFAGVLAATSALPAMAAVSIGQSPVRLTYPVPGNLVLVPSVEFPTLISVANFGDYVQTTSYVGYFDPDKCYKYVYATNEPDRHFEPVSPSVVHTCVGLWSGNFLNWATTQTIDPFRSALTGGYRVKDTSSETWLEKAVADRDSTGNFPRRTVPSSGSNLALVSSSMPAAWSSVRIRIDGLSNRMWLMGSGNAAANTAGGNLDTGSGGNPDGARPNTGKANATFAAIPYNPDKMLLDANPIGSDVKPTVGYGPLDSGVPNANQVLYEISVRVKVCDPTVGIEANCKLYPAGDYKPEGLLQQYSDKLTYSIFGYVNNGGSSEPDGGIMRARQKFIGPKLYYPDQNLVDNTVANNPTYKTSGEWDPNDGTLIRNPDAKDASDTNASYGLSGAYMVQDSGVINYLNKFGQMKTGRKAKSYDNVSELYYTALRYLKNQGNVPEYSNPVGANVQAKYQYADAFPVITAWDDPIHYRCQSNAIIGIGDTNTHDDKNLPANDDGLGIPSIPAGLVTSNSNEPGKGQSGAKPLLVRQDHTVNVIRSAMQILQMEGNTAAAAQTTATSSGFNGNSNSMYIAALAYDAHVNDLRPGIAGSQTASTYWVDVVENHDYKSKSTNQYYLAAKYGGFKVPTAYDPYPATPVALDDGAWWNSNEYIGDNPKSNNGFKRPDNFYTANQANKMVDSLRAAFKQVAAQASGTSAAFGASSTSLVNGSTLYQGRYTSVLWTGDVTAIALDPTTGDYAGNVWSASNQLTQTLSASITAWQSRKIYSSDATGATRIDFSASPLATSVLGTDVMNYLRGDRSNEGPGIADLRQRPSGLLGDVVDSQPVYVGAPSTSLYAKSTFTGASSYAAFAAANASRKSVVYVGANDGMLHAFDSSNGKELFAFVPRSAITPQLKTFAAQGYDHRYSVDGDIAVADVYAGGAWRTVLVGTLGRGGRGLYVLDVTDPTNPKVIGDMTATDAGYAAMGNNLGKPVIAQVSDGNWQIFFGNGPNGGSDDAELMRIGINGSTLATPTPISLGVAGNNGLAGPTIWSSTGNGFFDTAYAGDLKGNLYRVSNLGGTVSATTIFSPATQGAQPITIAPLVANRPGYAETWVFFGTGQYLDTTDATNKAVQIWYGIKVPAVGDPAVTKSQLVQRSIVAEDSTGRAISTGTAADLIGKSGWYINLLPPSGTAQGERMVVSNSFQGEYLVGVSLIPDATDPCATSGYGFVMRINPFTGARIDISPGTAGGFDLNHDGTSNDQDNVGGLPNSGMRVDNGANAPTYVGSTGYLTDSAGNPLAPIKAPPSGKATYRVAWREIRGD